MLIKNNIFIYRFLKHELNEVDLKLLFVIATKKHSIRELSDAVAVAPVNIWKHLNKLQKMGMVKIPKVKKGQKKYPEISLPYLKKQIKEIDNYDILYFDDDENKIIKQHSIKWNLERDETIKKIIKDFK